VTFAPLVSGANALFVSHASPSQSTGKSTLLNRLFATEFAVMNETSRQQTTKGIWANVAHGAPLLVLDVEGTDGRERGEDQDFERKSALFSLAISEVLLINMWESSVGLYQGANMGLLKTVFDIHVNLFQEPGLKTCLLFVVRDYTGLTPLDNLVAILQRDMENVWTSVTKVCCWIQLAYVQFYVLSSLTLHHTQPKDKESSTLADYFDFRYAALPHKVFAAQAFEQEAAALRARFYEPSHPDYLFSPQYHKRIPADGFPLFANSIWEKIVNNRDLDLPTQQELLAKFRCDDIFQVVRAEFISFLAPFKKQLEAGQVVDFAPIQRKMSWCMEEFDRDASRYNHAVYEAKRAQFSEELRGDLDVYVLLQLGNIQTTALAPLRKDFKLTSTLLKDCSSFMAACKLLRSEALTYAEGAFKALVAAGCSFEDRLPTLTKEVQQLLDVKLERASALVVSDMKVRLCVLTGSGCRPACLTNA
jgi:protein SEY1